MVVHAYKLECLEMQQAALKGVDMCHRHIDELRARFDNEDEHPAVRQAVLDATGRCQSDLNAIQNLECTEYGSEESEEGDSQDEERPACRQKQRDLHRRGLEVVQNAVRLTHATKAQIRQSPCEDIFNRKTKSGRLTADGKRQQTKGEPEWTPAVRAQLEGAIRAQGVLRCSQGEKSLARLVAIQSHKRTHRRKKHQPRHADSAPRNSLRDQRPEDVPLACIVALQDGTRLHVWPFDTGVKEVVVLNEGDMLLFRGDLGHAGAEYDEENWRLHVYIDSPVIERQTDEDGATLTFPF